jgi:hypothetical protein
MNDYATFQHHDKRHIDFPPDIIVRLDALHELVGVIVFFAFLA